MTLHVLVEGPSDSSFLVPWTRRLLKGTRVKVHPHQGKGSLPSRFDRSPNPKHRGLLDQLPAKLRAFSAALDEKNDKVLVLVDADDDDVQALEEKVKAAAEELAPNISVMVRLAVEETEAFYLGDLHALEKVFPDADLELAGRYVPDSICGTWELFAEILGDEGGSKVAWAEAMGPAITVFAARSRSPSFVGLLQGLRALAKTSGSKKQRRKKYRHPPKVHRDPSRKR